MKYFDRSKFLQEKNQFVDQTKLTRLNNCKPLFESLNIGEFDHNVLSILCQPDWRKQLDDKLNADLEADLNRTGIKNSKLRESMKADAIRENNLILNEIQMQLNGLHYLDPESFEINQDGEVVVSEKWVSGLEELHTSVDNELTKLIETFEQDFQKIKSMLPSRYPMVKDGRSKPGLLFIEHDNIEIDRSILKRL